MAIGKIDITDRFAIFEADARYEKDLLKGFKKGVTFEGNPVHVELTQVGPAPKDEKRRFNGDFRKEEVQEGQEARALIKIVQDKMISVFS